VLAIGASGMCGSDLRFYRGNVAEPCIGGHEPAGTVVAVGPGVLPTQDAVGDRVMVHYYAGSARAGAAGRAGRRCVPGPQLGTK
jgi:D-arabinose 1-dehydrogenase-like Zn-dependent alcohol dehydrogenase